MKILKKIDGVLQTILKFGMIVSAFTVFVVIFLQVLCRFVLKITLGWGSDITRLSFVYSIFLGAAYVASQNGHLNLTFLVDLMPKKVKGVIEALVDLVMVLFIMYIGIRGVSFTSSAVSQRMSYLKMPMSVMYIVIPFSMFCMAFFYLQFLIIKLKETFGHETIEGGRK